MKKELNFREQAFKALYLQSFNATQAALGAGYAESVAAHQAYKWVGITSCPVNKVHLRDAIQADIDSAYPEDVVDSAWVLKRARLLADFNINTFVKVGANKKAVYDFSEASHDDWYCISEYTVDQISKGGSDDIYDVERTKIKTHCKLRALELVGKHVSVQAFKDQVEHTGAIAMEITRTVVDPDDK